MDAVGNGITVILSLAVAVPQMPVTVSVYTPGVATVTDGVVSPVDHEFPVADVEVRITDSPGQNVVGPLAVIPAVVSGFTVTVSLSVAVPHTVVTLSV